MLSATRGTFEPGNFEGFGYLLGPPSPTQQSQLGANPADAKQLLTALTKALPVVSPISRYWPNPLRAGADPDDNPFIPSGYTYLLQLVAHDLVHTTVPFWMAAEIGLPSRNVRARRLFLDTLYEGGPTASPVAYSLGRYAASDRTKLRVGRYAPALGGTNEGSGACPYRDLARINPLAWTTPGALRPANFDYAHVTCVADARNDDNLILMQLVSLFCGVHNAIASAQAGSVASEAVLGFAQCLMRLIYYNIIEKDLLPRILNESVAKDIVSRDSHDRRWLWTGNGVPLEFSHGAFRVGHAMVRHEYRMNSPGLDPVPIFQSVRGKQNVAEQNHALPEQWVVQWSRFFDLVDGSASNYSRRLSPTLSALDVAHLFQTGSTDDSLTVRDLLSGAMARAWRVDALIDAIVAANPGIIPNSWPFFTADQRGAAINQWLTTKCQPGALSSDDIATLCDDPPLPFFVLLESALDPTIEGKHFGLLGSIIIGEVIGKCLAIEKERLAPLLAGAKAAFDPGFWDEASAIASMADFFNFAKRHLGMEICAVPFI
jgi:hypothetical protein